MTDEREIRDYS